MVVLVFGVKATVALFFSSRKFVEKSFQRAPFPFFLHSFTNSFSIFFFLITIFPSLFAIVTQSTGVQPTTTDRSVSETNGSFPFPHFALSDLSLPPYIILSDSFFSSNSSIPHLINHSFSTFFQSTVHHSSIAHYLLFSSFYPSSHLPTTIIHPSSYFLTTIIHPSSYPLTTTIHPSSHPPTTTIHPSSHPPTTTIHPSSHPPTTTIHPSSHPPTTTIHSLTHLPFIPSFVVGGVRILYAITNSPNDYLFVVVVVVVVDVFVNAEVVVDVVVTFIVDFVVVDVVA